MQCVQAESAAKAPSHASRLRAPAVDVSKSMTASWMHWAAHLRLPPLNAKQYAPYDYFQAAKDRKAYTLTNLAQYEELPPEVMQTDAPEPPEDPAMSRLEAFVAKLEARMIKLEKKVTTMAATAPKRKVERGKPIVRKTRIERRAAQDRGSAHNSGPPCWQFMQNSGAVFPAHDLSVRNSHGWNGVAHAASTNIPSPHMPARAEAKNKLAINTAGRTLVNAARKALAWMSKIAAAVSLHEVVRWIIGSHGQGGG